MLTGVDIYSLSSKLSTEHTKKPVGVQINFGKESQRNGYQVRSVLSLIMYCLPSCVILLLIFVIIIVICFIISESDNIAKISDHSHYDSIAKLEKNL